MAEITLETLAKELETLKSQNEQLAADNAKLVSLVGKQTTVEVKEAEKLVIPETPVTVGKKKFKFLVPKFIFEKETFIAEQLVADAESKPAQDLLKKLVEIEAGFLQEVK